MSSLKVVYLHVVPFQAEFHGVQFWDHCFFLVFINDLPSSAGVSGFYLFADDGEELNNDLQILHHDVQSYLNWATTSLMLFNVFKTQFLSVSKTKDYYSQNIGGEVVHPVNTVKELGNFVSENHKLNVHLLRRLGLCFSPLASLKRNLRLDLPLETKLKR